jgi:hypothetical protein
MSNASDVTSVHPWHIAHRVLQVPDQLVFVVEWAIAVVLMVALEAGALLFIDLVK